MQVFHKIQNKLATPILYVKGKQASTGFLNHLLPPDYGLIFRNRGVIWFHTKKMQFPIQISVFNRFGELIWESQKISPGCFWIRFPFKVYLYGRWIVEVPRS